METVKEIGIYEEIISDQAAKLVMIQADHELATKWLDHSISQCRQAIQQRDALEQAMRFWFVAAVISAAVAVFALVAAFGGRHS